MNKNFYLFFIFFFLILLNFYLWQGVFSLFSEKGEVCFLNVGQGDAELVKMPRGIYFLIDSGPSGEKVISQLEKNMPFFKKRIEVAFLSHSDFDHWAGFEKVVKNYNLEAFFWNNYLPRKENLKNRFINLLREMKEKGILVKTLSYPNEVIYDNYHFKIIWPRKNSPFKSTNNNSLVIILKSPSGERVIFTGDIEKPAEKRIFSIYGKNLKAEILKVPHHGSKSSLEASFIKAVEPKEAVIEVGKNNPYHQPHKKTIDFLKILRIKIWRTDLNGTVCFSL